MSEDTLGQFGGRVIRAFTADKKFIAGATLTSDDVKDWPLRNRTALASSGKVEFYTRPADVTLDELSKEIEETLIPSDAPDKIEEEPKPKSNRRRKPKKE